MKEMTAREFSASEVSSNPNETARIVVIPSGFPNTWIMVIEDIDYSVSAEYIDWEHRKLLVKED